MGMSRKKKLESQPRQHASFVFPISTFCLIQLYWIYFTNSCTSKKDKVVKLQLFYYYINLRCFCLFLLPLGVWEGLRLVIVALPELFSHLLWIYFTDGVITYLPEMYVATCGYRGIPCKIDFCFISVDVVC